MVTEEKVESAGPGVQEHQDSGEDSPAAPVGQEEIEEVGGAPKDEEMPACKQEDNEEAALEVGAPVPHVRKSHSETLTFHVPQGNEGVAVAGATWSTVP